MVYDVLRKCCFTVCAVSVLLLFALLFLHIVFTVIFADVWKSAIFKLIMAVIVLELTCTVF